MQARTNWITQTPNWCNGRDVFFRIIVMLVWFWLCETWLSPRFLKYVIEIHVDVWMCIRYLKIWVSMGRESCTWRIAFLYHVPHRSTSLKLIDHSPTHNTSKKRVSSYILTSLNVHWCISEQMSLVVSSDAWTHPAWRNWLVFPHVYYAYILVRLVVACTVKYNNHF